jgi:hypothetical protein
MARRAPGAKSRVVFMIRRRSSFGHVIRTNLSDFKSNLQFTLATLILADPLDSPVSVHQLALAMRNLVILGGSSHPSLTKSICNRLGVPEGNIVLGKFSNGETSIQIQESVRGKDVFIITTGCGEINEILMELFIMLSACKTASAKRNHPPRHSP